MGGQLNWSHFA